MNSSLRSEQEATQVRSLILKMIDINKKQIETYNKLLLTIGTDAPIQNPTIHTLTPLQKFISEILNKGVVLSDGIEYAFDSYIKKTIIYDLFKNTTNNNIPKQMFWRSVSEMIGCDHNKTQPRKINGVSIRCIKLPKLEDARNAFRNHIGDEE